MRLYRKHLAPIYGDFISLVSAAHDALPLNTDSWSPIDKEVLDDSSKIHYKYHDDEVKPEVVALVTSKIPIYVVESFIQRYFTGVVI
jgi:hypothetical protein